jgi:uncharacterized protein YjbI with pentapeptide repeats
VNGGTHNDACEIHPVSACARSCLLLHNVAVATCNNNGEKQRQRVARWLQHPRSKILIVAVIAVALAVLTALQWQNIQEMLGSRTGNLSWFWGSVIVAVTFSVIGLLVYFVAEDKRLWDLLQLLVVPFALVVIGLWFTAQQDTRQSEIEEQRAQDATLQAYLDQMSQLILHEELLKSELNKPVHTLAQARTSTVFLQLDAEHNRSVTRFLTDSGLSITEEGLDERPGPPMKPIKLLLNIRLENARLRNAYLPDADLSLASLRGAHLSDALLYRANLTEAILIRADLRGAALSGANLSKAHLNGADLRNAALQSRPDLGLTAANLAGADLTGADLTGATGITREQLEQQASSLACATMPDGKKLPC